jgi:trans-2,3-dihydro-3-hydroxyanthranilate isomerase
MTTAARCFEMVQVDVFTDRPLAGNPLAVFPAADGLSDTEMRALATEMNLSETTFVTPPRAGGDARVRIFTPETELPFAGHPSVGTACVLVSLGVVPAVEPVTRVVLELGVGPTLVEVAVAGGLARGATVHQGPPRFGAAVPRDAAAAVLGLSPDGLHETLDAAVVGTGLDYAIIPLRDREALGRVVPQGGLVAAFERDFAEVYPCALVDDPEAEDAAAAWVEARGLFPLCGIPEDPATGSAAGPLAAYFWRAGLLPAGETRTVLQGARIRRPSLLDVTVTASGDAADDVLVGGGVAEVMTATVTLP